MVQIEIVPAKNVNPLKRGGLTEGYKAHKAGVFVTSDNPVMQDFWNRALKQYKVLE